MGQSQYFDALETREAEARDSALFKAIQAQIQHAQNKAPGWKKHLAGIDAQSVTSREALAALPVLRKSALKQHQEESPPFGGFVAGDDSANAFGGLARVFMSPGPIFDPEGRDADWWGVGRALFAAGGRKGDLIHNSFAYHLTPAGHMFENGAIAVGCAVFPAGTGDITMQIEAASHLSPRGFTGTPDFLKMMLDKAQELGKDLSCFKFGLVSGAALPNSLREELSNRGVPVVQCYGTADLGIVAYEVPGEAGMIINEDYLVEIVTPGTGDPVSLGDVGEVVVTRINADYPMIRFATGDMSAVLEGQSPCGRTNMRIKGWMGRADQTTKIRGMFVHPEQVAEIVKKHSEIEKLRFVVTREKERDVLSVKAECQASIDKDIIAESIQAVCKVRAEVELVKPGELPNDGIVIADERDYD